MVSKNSSRARLFAVPCPACHPPGDQQSHTWLCEWRPPRVPCLGQRPGHTGSSAGSTKLPLCLGERQAQASGDSVGTRFGATTTSCLQDADECQGKAVLGCQHGAGMHTDRAGAGRAGLPVSLLTSPGSSTVSAPPAASPPASAGLKNTASPDFGGFLPWDVSRRSFWVPGVSLFADAREDAPTQLSQLFPKLEPWEYPTREEAKHFPWRG